MEEGNHTELMVKQGVYAGLIQLQNLSINSLDNKVNKHSSYIAEIEQASKHRLSDQIWSQGLRRYNRHAFGILVHSVYLETNQEVPLVSEW